MSRYLFTFLLLAAAFVPRFAAAQLFSGGFFGGVTGTQVDGDKFAGFNKGGFTASATVQYPIAPKFLAALEIGFTQKGAQSKQIVSTGGPAFPNVFNLRVNYVDLPLMVKFYDRRSFGLGVGIQYSRLVGDAKQFIDPFTQHQIRGIDVGFENYDVSGIAEGSYYFNPNIQLNIRYSYGWTPMGYSSESDYKNFAAFNNVIQVRIGYIFGQAFDEKPKDRPARNVQ